MFEELAVLPTATGIIARLAVRRLEAAGIDPNPLLAAVGLNRVLVFDDNRISALSQVELLTLAGQALKDDWIGITLASAFDLRELGLLYYVAASAQRLGDAFQRLDRYLRLANEALDLHVSVASECRIGVTYTGIARHLDRHQAEFLAVTFLRLCRQLVGSQITPSRVEFVHHRSGDLSPLRRAFGCVPSFGEHVDEVCFASATFNLPLVGADSYLSNLMVKACDDALTKRPHNASPLRIQVENAIAPLLPHAEAKAARIAKQIGMSERTLSRRLRAEGSTFDQILDGLRRELAVQYLEDPTLPISQIAWLLGFHQPSALSHACRRWLGRTPLQYRRQHIAGLAGAAAAG